eukprot:scaffold48991_cov63-Phaeocystis_antarctica.AAC.3
MSVAVVIAHAAIAQCPRQGNVALGGPQLQQRSPLGPEECWEGSDEQLQASVLVHDRAYDIGLEVPLVAGHVRVHLAVAVPASEEGGEG